MKKNIFIISLTFTFLFLFSCTNGILSLKSPNDADKVIMPVITSDKNEASDKITITISSATKDAKIKYTLDNTNPSKNSGTNLTNGGQFVLSSVGTITVKAIALMDDLHDSEISSKIFKINGKLTKPTITPSKTLTKPEQITIFVPSQTTVRYTLNGETYYTSQNISLTIEKTTTISAVTTKENYLDSDPENATYTFTGECPPPALTMSNNFNATTKVTIYIPVFKDQNGNYVSPTVYYTIDGSDPTVTNNSKRSQTNKDKEITIEENK
ncbi:MAG TPA: chitobiase/beta-hexosaminidase C-terminal domain-containing protein, partial [Spirochaetota bacterium]|nr:chitobiase/beta-hexosaminidase C-terminal domain-containing protein [Spirochaetota bacterium]